VGCNNNPGKAYVFLGGTLPNGNKAASELAHIVLKSDSLGIPFDGYYGSSVSGVGDLNDDGYDDVVVGAPGVDKAVISYGYKDKVTVYPDLWDDDTASKDVVTFDKGVSNTNNDLNTWGLDGDDDGWDWIDSFSDPSNLYGQTSPAPHDNANLYAPFELDGPDADGLTWNNKSALEVMIGRNHTHLSPYGDGWDWDPGTSAAWGIEFNIDQELYDYISKNSSIEISFDYEATDSTRIYNNSNLSRNFIYTMLTRIWNSNGIEYLGDISVNDKNYFFYHQDNWNVPAWGPIYGSFEWDITDLIIAPGSYYWDFGCYFERRWSSRYDDGIMAFFDNITMKISNEKHTIIQGVENSGFGTAIAPLGDVNEDGNPDMLIGAPYIDSGLAALIQGKERFSTTESIGLAKVILTGNEPGDKFGYSLSSAGDVDNDGLQDVIIGAPGGNYAQLYYGNTLKTGVLVPDLWEKNEEMDTPQIEFDSGLKSTGNTPGLSAPNDGWDTWNGVYGYESGATAGSSVKFNGADGTDSDQVAADDELIIAIGGGLGGGSTTGATPDSGAYGVKFTISSEMAAAIKAGGKAVLSYDWYFENIGLDQDDTIWIKTSIRNQTDVLDLGWDLDNYAAVNDNKDDTKEVHWAELPDDMRSAFIQRCSECFSNAGSYYLDIGAKVRNYWWDTTWEDGVSSFPIRVQSSVYKSVE